jgi:phenylacetate-coenzyme A ligase PaaK-like adenylate-forming protein
LEDTLRTLREAGVYVTFEEFKGRQPMVRGGRVISVQARDFDNPYLRHYYEAETGGTTGPATRVPVDWETIAARAPQLMLARHAHGVLHAPMAVWRGILPDHSGLNSILHATRYGQVPDRWFSPVVGRDPSPSLGHRLATRYIVRAGRLLGTPIPEPELVPLDCAHTVAHWVADALATRGAVLLSCHVSLALRVALAAQECGLELTGATFMGGGEPPTPAKVRAIERAGVRWVSTYFFAEAGAVGLGCARPADPTDVHLMKDTLALIQSPRQVPDTGATVGLFLVTSLLLEAPKLLLNVESDDYGLVEGRRCGCALEACGLTEHLRHIRSLRKLTGEGVTLLASDLVRILEEELPACFGGSPLDYQLLEEEDERGFTRLNLLVHPRIELPDETLVIDTVHRLLQESSALANAARAIWQQARTLRLQRGEPITTARGKQMPLHRYTAVDDRPPIGWLHHSTWGKEPSKRA